MYGGFKKEDKENEEEIDVFLSEGGKITTKQQHSEDIVTLTEENLGVFSVFC